MYVTSPLSSLWISQIQGIPTQVFDKQGSLLHFEKQSNYLRVGAFYQVPPKILSLGNLSFLRSSSTYFVKQLVLNQAPVKPSQDSLIQVSDCYISHQALSFIARLGEGSTILRWILEKVRDSLQVSLYYFFVRNFDYM